MKITSILIGLLCFANLYAQVDTSLVVDEVVIMDQGMPYMAAREEVRLVPWQLQNRDFSNTLNGIPSIHLKSYGLGSLATSTIRGGSASHTLVLWNEVPIQSPLLGLLDLSLLHQTAFNKASLVKGGSSAVWGSGAVAGVLSFNSDLANIQTSEVSVRLTTGSFGYQQYAGSWTVDKTKWISKTSIDRETAVNDFSYSIREDLPKRLQSNAAYQKLNATHSSTFLLNKDMALDVHYWYQHVNREIPPTTTQTASTARQEDRAHRLVTSIRQDDKSGQTKLTLSYANEELNFFDPTFSIDSPSQFQRYFGKLHRSWRISDHLTMMGNINTDITKAEAVAFDQTVDEFRIAGLTQLEYTMPTMLLSVSVRKEKIDENWIPIMPIFAAKWQPHSSIVLQGSVNRNYRVPTLNDRFWQPGGKLDLQAESGWAQDLGLSYAQNFSSLSINTGINVYNRLMSNWILWTIGENDSFFSPFNIAQVHSRGIELSSKLQLRLPASVLSVNATYDYTRSTNQVALDLPQIEKGEQLLYTPVHQGNLSGEFQHKSLKVLVETLFTGKSSGINEDVAASVVTNLLVDYSILKGDKKPIDAALILRINNIFNESYFIIERRPMPGAHFRLGLQLKFKK